MRATGLAAVVVLVLGVAGPANSGAPAGELVFASTRAADLHDEIYVLDTQTGRRTNLSRNATRDALPSVSPDGRLIAFVSDRGGRGEAIWVVNARSGRLQRLHRPLDHPLRAIQWSPNGSRLAFGGGPSVYVVAAGGGNVRRIARGSDPQWVSPRALALNSDGLVQVYDLSGRRVSRTVGMLHSVSARGELTVLNNRIDVVSASSGRRRALVRGVSAAWNPQGTLLAYDTATPPTIRLLDRDGRIRVLARGYRLGGYWALDGRSLLAWRDEAQPRNVAIRLDGRIVGVGPGGGVWLRPGTALMSEDARRRLAIRPSEKLRRLIPTPAQEPCPSLVGEAVWLDSRRAVIALGHAGQNDPDLWSANASGGPLRRLHDDSEWSAQPESSPDGRWLVYERGEVHTHAGGCQGPMTPDLRVAAADGSDDRALTAPSDGHFQQMPRWSPDGRHVAFHRKDLSDQREFGVFLIDVATRVLRRLSIGFGEGVSWSPDGTRVVFSGKGSLWVGRTTGGDANRLAAGSRPEWSPTADEIAFVHRGQLWAIESDGSTSRRLAPLRPVGEVRWARDGSALTFAVRAGVVVVGRGGTVRRRISHAGARNPRLSPDGRFVAFVGPVGDWSLAPRTELFVADVGRGSVRRLTNDFADVGAPTWR